MTIIIIAPGSRGDVQPYVALGKGLRGAGHTVKILTFQTFEKLVTEHGLTFVDIGGNVHEIMQRLQKLIEKGQTLKVFAEQKKAAQKISRQAAINGLTACQDADLILAGSGGFFIGLSLSEKLHIPFLQAHVWPFTPTKSFPSVLTPLPATLSSGHLNWLSHRLMQQILWQMNRSSINKMRNEVLQLPKISLSGPYSMLEKQTHPVLYGYSLYVLPHPNDWPKHIHITGDWALEPATDWQPPTDLIDFLKLGKPPVYIGFGSMSSSKPEELTDLVLQSLKRTNQRGILSTGWNGLKKEQLPPTVFMVDSIPHSWLFPQMAAVVHHGGAGTTAAGLKAGVPSIITPFFGDQPFWGKQVDRLGVGAQPIARRHLSADKLSKAIEQVTSDEQMQERTAALGNRIRSEDGVRKAVDTIESTWGKW